MKRQAFSFLMVGAIGFLIDAGLTQLLVSAFGVHAFYARMPAIVMAVVVTFFLNKHHTFQAGASCVRRSFKMYIACVAIAQGGNFLIYNGLLHAAGWFHVYPFLAVAIGSICAASITFFLSKYWVFKVKNHD